MERAALCDTHMVGGDLGSQTCSHALHLRLLLQIAVEEVNQPSLEEVCKHL